MLPNTSPTPAYDDPLDNLIQANLVLITGITGDLVRPRFQPEPATHPDASTDWVAFGMGTYDSDTFPSITHNPAGNGGAGSDIVERDEIITLNLSFYGPNNARLISQYREGIQVESNRWDLASGGLALVGVGQVINLPALLKDRWVKRLDTKVTFRRRASRTYNVPHLLSAPVVLRTEANTVNITAP